MLNDCRFKQVHGSFMFPSSAQKRGAGSTTHSHRLRSGFRSSGRRSVCNALILATIVAVLGLSSPLQAQNPNNYDSAKIIQALIHPHNDLVMVVAHRGIHADYPGRNYAGNTPENSLSSIGLAAQRGAEIIEVDIKLTSDNVALLSHDTTSGREMYNAGLSTQFDPFAPQTTGNDLLNPQINLDSASQWQTLKLRDSVHFYASEDRPPTLDDVLTYMTTNKIASVLALDIKDDATAQVCWRTVKAHTDYNGRPYSQSVLFKMPGRVYKSSSDFAQAFGADYKSVLFWPFYGTADISPQAFAIDGSYGTDSSSAAGFGSEAAIIASIRSFQQSSVQLVGTEVNLKQSGGILTDVLAAAKVSNSVAAASVGSFQPTAEYQTLFGDAQFFYAAGSKPGYCCYMLKDLFYNGAPYNQPSDTADTRNQLTFLLANGDDVITTDLAVDAMVFFGQLGKRNISYLQASTAGGGGGGTGGTSSLRLLPLGDSITYGQYSSTNNGYRGPLRDELVHEGFSADFVGTLSAGTMNDNYNEGHSGLRIDQVDGFVGGPMGQYRPNVVTLMLGTNDMNQSYDLANAPARLGKIIDDVLSKGPDAAVLVASLVPSTDPVVEANIVAYNQQVPGVVQARASQGKHVAFANMSAVTTADLANTLHPNDGGYQKIADAFNAAVQQASSAGWITTPVPCASIGAGCSDVAVLAGSQPASQNAGGGSSGGAGVNQQVRYADFDGDGKADYIVVSATGGMTVWYNRGGNTGGGFDGPHQVANGLAPGGEVQLADFDGDGKVDYIVVLPSGEVKVQLNRGGDGNGGWLDLGHVANGTGPASQTRFADLDGDGKADYLQVSPTGGVSVWFNNGGDGRGGWSCGCQIANGVAPSANIQFADFDGDGKADYIVVADDGSVDVWLNQGGNGRGGWQETGKVANGVAPGNQVLFADFDGDGRADYLVVQQSTGETEAWLNRGGDGRSLTGWVPEGFVALGVGAQGSKISFADIDGDGRADYLVSLDPAVGSYRGLLNKGGTFNNWQWSDQGTIAYGVGKASSERVLFGDVNGDGKADYMVLPPPGTGGDAYYYANAYTPSGGWQWTDESRKAFIPGTENLANGDVSLLAALTNSKKADLVTVYEQTGGVTAVINHVNPSDPNSPDWTTTDPNTPSNVATGVGYPGHQVRIADMNGDGKADYIIVDNTGAVQVLMNESGGGAWTFSPPYRVPGRIDCKTNELGSPTPDFDYTQFADINGDGRADYLCIERDNGAVRAWRNVDLGHGSTTGWTQLGKVANGVGVQ